LVAHETDPEVQARQLEKHSVLTSLDNLMTFPFIKDRVDQGLLSMHGLWTDIGEGGLEYFNPDAKEFQKV
jgi:carbonic anhydrase